MNGTFSSGDPMSTSNTTDISARAAWHFLQSFLSAFPQYNPGVRPNSSQISTTGVNLFAESYGGTYGPTFANYFEEQNKKRENGTLPKNSTLEIKLTSLGIVNGLIDSLIQDYYYATFAYNNTFGIQAISQTDELNLIEQYNNECSKQTTLCRSLANQNDPEGEGDNQQANVACQAATYFCNSLMFPFERSNLSVYDIRVKDPSPDPSNAYLEYLNTASVQQAIGARVNYTTSSSAVMGAFIRTGDSIRGGQIQDIANLLRSGVRVSLIYGDADYIVRYFFTEDDYSKILTRTLVQLERRRGCFFRCRSGPRELPFERIKAFISLWLEQCRLCGYCCQHELCWRCCTPVWQLLFQSDLRRGAHGAILSTRNCLYSLHSCHRWH